MVDGTGAAVGDICLDAGSSLPCPPQPVSTKPAHMADGTRTFARPSGRLKE